MNRENRGRRCIRAVARSGGNLSELSRFYAFVLALAAFVSRYF